ncbi:uncharacterized protein TRUGW13939_10165 [Talaromyces rugulosus]|uniref:Uncharacterized protein n=1 Tax=Talaromyces rugulosus TaxID=121627 RepID=A0A7H8RA41_TALRU|nr:uncharacterized protein TRUGW13939_10165 [Talaromyces rugulosus]QKX62997.1 hypothetical protein TRUGW13939_10165 [Talaromyces rugulosus]
MPDVVSKEKKQPWKAFESSFGRDGKSPITYDAPKGSKLEIAGTSGELSLDILYDTGDYKDSAPNTDNGGK